VFSVRSERLVSKGCDRPSVGQKSLVVGGYAFDDQDELVPGLWSLELWQSDRKLLEKSFVLYRYTWCAILPDIRR
jgi:hypothetical protein